MYKAILFAPDGDYVTDHRAETIAEVEGALADQGSRWYFYPFEAVIADNGSISEKQRLVSVAPELEAIEGRTIKTAAAYIAANAEALLP